MTEVQHWADVLHLRPEVALRHGHADGLQMSLYEAAYQTTDVPYRDPTYWCDITEPTVKLVEFMAAVAIQLAGVGPAGRLNLTGAGDSLFHLDQGMGGGKSHSLVGLHHMAASPVAFFDSEVGAAVSAAAAQRAGKPVTFADVRGVILCADHFTPGAARPEFGPAINLHQRFLWSLFAGDRALYDRHVAAGADKAALKDAILAVGRPVLILLDEVMDYAMALSAPEQRDRIAAEQVFLNALSDVVNEEPGVAAVVVMIRSDLDEAGYEGAAADFRSYLSRRLERNGTTVSVNEPQDFAAIIRRRIFTRPDRPLPIRALAGTWEETATRPWREQVFDRLPGARQLSGFAARLERSYPFHPDLLDLVEHDWTQHAGFQRVRSTVEVFTATAYWWANEHDAGRWAPPLLGVGDIPLHVAADEVLGSGLLHGNERQVVGMRQVAEKDVTTTDRKDGQAVLIDERMTEGRPWAAIQPQPAVRMATALWMYSVATRAHSRRGATKAELLAAVYVPNTTFGYGDAEEIFNVLSDDEEERGLGTFDTILGGGGNTPNRYQLVTHLNKRSFQRNALNRTTPEDSYALIWERLRILAQRGSGFNDVVPIPDASQDTPLKEIFGDVDQRRSNRLVILHPRRWSLLNGRDQATRDDIEALLGLGPNALSVDFAASCVIACVNTQRRDALVKRARSAFAWRLATNEVDHDSDLHADMADETRHALEQVDAEIRSAYQHLAYLVRDDQRLRVDHIKFEDEKRSALSGNDVWEELAKRGDAVFSATGLSGAYLHKLLDLSDRSYTLAEVVEKFWRDPVFPLIPSDSIARRALFDALKADVDGVAWEIVGPAGDPIAVAAPELLAISSHDHFLRVAVTNSVGSADHPGAELPTITARVDGAAANPPPGQAGPVQYRVHRLALRNRSLADRTSRDQLWRLLMQLADTIDPAGNIDVQVASIQIELNAAVGSLSRVAEKSEAAGATWEELEEDF